MATTRALDHFILNYVHQDFAALFGSTDGAVDTFVSESPLARDLPRDIDALLLTEPDEASVRDRLGELGIGFDPGDLGYRGWLQEIADRVRAATGA
jgi:hypothetical protein